eukprot:s894_g1.t1
MWLGGTYSIRKFVDVFLQHKIAQQLVTFTGVPIHLDCTAGYTAEQWHQWIIDRLRDQTAVARRAYDEKLQAAERSRKAQLEADARREQSQHWQSRGPHPYGALQSGRDTAGPVPHKPATGSVILRDVGVSGSRSFVSDSRVSHEPEV